MGSFLRCMALRVWRERGDYTLRGNPTLEAVEAHVVNHARGEPNFVENLCIGLDDDNLKPSHGTRLFLGDKYHGLCTDSLVKFHYRLMRKNARFAHTRCKRGRWNGCVNKLIQAAEELTSGIIQTQNPDLGYLSRYSAGQMSVES